MQTLSHHDDSNETLCQDGTKRVEQFAFEATRWRFSYRLSVALGATFKAFSVIQLIIKQA